MHYRHGAASPGVAGACKGPKRPKTTENKSVRLQRGKARAESKILRLRRKVIKHGSGYIDVSHTFAGNDHYHWPTNHEPIHIRICRNPSCTHRLQLTIGINS